jgi:hypothetical protein
MENERRTKGKKEGCSPTNDRREARETVRNEREERGRITERKRKSVASPRRNEGDKKEYGGK